MMKAALSMLSLLALSFSLVACVAQSTDETDAIGDEQVDSPDEAVGEAEQAITASGVCLGADILPTGYRLCFNGICSAYGNGSAPASITCNQYPYSTCQFMYGPNQTVAYVPCPLAGGNP